MDVPNGNSANGTQVSSCLCRHDLWLLKNVRFTSGTAKAISINLGMSDTSQVRLQIKRNLGNMVQANVVLALLLVATARPFG